jgi:succinate dehydrogenase/fumarate reductase flavoprotein subunit
VVHCLELDNLALSAEAIALAALRRDESRGTHYRAEFPEQNDAAWRCNLRVRQEAGGGLVVYPTPVVTD